MKFLKKIFTLILFFAVFGILFFGLYHRFLQPYDGSGNKDNVSADLSALAGGDHPDTLLQVHFIDVGQGDATLIICQGHAMLIDGGDNSKGTAVWLYLEKQGVSSLDYVVATHPDADHIGGLDVILYKYETGSVLMPDLENDTQSYQGVMDVIKEKEYRPLHPVRGDIFYLGDAKITVLAPVPGKSHEETNNHSIVLRLEYQDISFLFAGDAEYEEMEDILEKTEGKDEGKVTVYKAAHHGSASSFNRKFLFWLDPVYAVISCGKDNDYGHPHEEILNYFTENKIEVYRTDVSGNIVAYSDGKKLAWDMEKDQE